jgi:hypothetical protein
MNIQQINTYAKDNLVQSHIALSQHNIEKSFLIARPILVFLGGFFLIPKKIRTILNHLVEVLDVIYSIKISPSKSNTSR